MPTTVCIHIEGGLDSNEGIKKKKEEGFFGKKKKEEGTSAIQLITEVVVAYLSAHVVLSKKK